MYKNSHSRSFSRGGGGRNFQRRPFFRGRGGSGRRFGGGGRGRGVSKLTGNPSLFVKKAIEITSESTYVAQNHFTDFPISEELKKNIQDKGYKDLTPVQDQAIGPILEGRDLIGLAATGTGKTAAFLIPAIDKMLKDPSIRTLVVAPTRELASQINQEFKEFTKGMRLYSTLLIGGASFGRQVNDLRRGSNMVVATPGRLKDLIQRNTLNLNNYSIFILDEVDLMVDIGFIRDIKFFVSLLPKTRQSLFFSATIPDKIIEIINSFVVNPVRVSVKKQETSENVDQDIVKVVNREKKIEQLHELLIKEEFTKVMIFGRTKHGVERLSRELEDRGFRVGAIHGNKKQSQRQRILQSFKQNNIQVLLATDVASRGLDINGVTHVINYDLPETYEDYIHRIGRTGRAGRTGVALTFVE